MGTAHCKSRWRRYAQPQSGQKLPLNAHRISTQNYVDENARQNETLQKAGADLEGKPQHEKHVIAILIVTEHVNCKADLAIKNFHPSQSGRQETTRRKNTTLQIR